MTMRISKKLLGTFLYLAIVTLSLFQYAKGQSITFHNTARKFDCPQTAFEPTKLSSVVDDDRGEGITKYILLSPTGNTETELCTLTRVDNEFNRVYIPIARSYGGDWHRVQGKYLSGVSVECGESSTNGPGYDSGDYLCQVAVPPLGATNDGYYLTRFVDEAPSDRTKAARFLERTTWGASE